MDKMRILFSDALFSIAYKPHGIPTVPLKGQPMEGTLLGLVAEQEPEVLKVSGKNPWEFGAVHRLDTATAGLVIFAKDQHFYDHLQKMQLMDLFSKTYQAETIKDDRLKGFEPPAAECFTISSYFRSYGPGAKQVRAVTDPKRADSQVLYSTVVKKTENGFVCTITRGFRHQIRAHLAWSGNPIVGDPLYGPDDKPDQTLRLECIGVSFPRPDGKPFSFSL